ncbi:unnamed protein product [Auanema sp. JU1783]|nr:unnamed protein product [Auanema sp. JU1783]
MFGRLEGKAEECVQKEDYYEAHQIYRTLCFRYKNSKSFSDLLRVSYNGSMTLLKKKQFESGVDMGCLFVEALIVSDTKPTAENIEKIIMFLEMQLEMEKEATDAGLAIKRFRVATDKFISDAVKWSQQHSRNPREAAHGTDALNKSLAETFSKFDDIERARTHYLLSEDAEGFSRFLIASLSKFGEPDEHDLFIALAVLQLLCLKRAKTAWTLFTHYIGNSPVGYGELPCKYPLINFIWLLLLAVPKRNSATFCDLVNKYTPSLDRDPQYKPLLDKIGKVFFKISEPGAAGGFLGNMLRGLMGGERAAEEQFRASDVEFEDDVMIVDEDGYTTANDSDGNDGPGAKQSAVDQMDDLD